MVWQFISIFGDMPFWFGLFFGSVLIYIVLRRQTKNKVAWVVFSLMPATVLATSFQL